MQDNSAPEKSEVAATLARSKSCDRRPSRKQLLATVGLLALGGIAIFWWQRDTPAATPRFKTQAVQRGDLQMTVTATGNLAPVNQVQVGSELSGIVKSVEVDYNDHVKVGQVLARLDTSKLAARDWSTCASLEAARAKVLQTKATVAETTRNMERLQTVREMSQGKAVSKHDLEAAQAALDRARADQASAEAAISQNEAVLKAIET
ncbi:MAG TPA: biotin/lipoyl-binding protein, partial [Desulfurivibrionaceae bacterium]|nr:biotin/lipoyl-binding protein [Desulfurivibrionaceae bacterium]